MVVEDRNILDAFTEDFCDVVQKYTEYIVVSGFVAIASGRARGTEDIDMIVSRIPIEYFVALHQELVDKGFVCMQSADAKTIYVDYLSKDLSVRYTYESHLLPQMEVKMEKDPVDTYQLKTKTKLPLTGLDIWFSNINVNLAFKEHLLKSDKDLEDAKHLRIVYSELVNEAEINKVRELIERYR